MKLLRASGVNGEPLAVDLEEVAAVKEVRYSMMDRWATFILRSSGAEIATSMPFQEALFNWEQALRSR